MSHWELVLFFFIIAAVYASVGFGGGSSYLAILAVYALPFQEIRLTALICNIVVVTGGTILFIRKGQVDLRKIIPLVAVSVPMAYLGATLKISEDVFFVLLGCSLLAAGALLWMKTGPDTGAAAQVGNTYVRDGLLGGAVGFLSGMVGIGGGIFLSPLLNLAKWDVAKKIAAAASVFILVNSIAGIAGQLSQLPEDVNYMRMSILGVAVLAGGQLGSRLVTVRFNHLVIRRVTAVLVFVAGIEVLIKHIQ
jgi:uncharacterized membrane protein YfcA